MKQLKGFDIGDKNNDICKLKNVLVWSRIIHRSKSFDVLFMNIGYNRNKYVASTQVSSIRSLHSIFVVC